MKKEAQLKKETREPIVTGKVAARTVTHTYTLNLDEAINAVYRKYGTDLPKFFRDAYDKEIARKNEQAMPAEVHP